MERAVPRHAIDWSRPLPVGPADGLRRRGDLGGARRHAPGSGAGDPDGARVVDVRAGPLRVKVSLFPPRDADHVVLRLTETT